MADPVTSAESAYELPIVVAVASGKGGTGKTLVSTNLALVAARSGRSVTLVDCDADAPNVALFLQPERVLAEDVTVRLPVVDDAACTLCGVCRRSCVFGAIRILGPRVIVFPELCHSCGACRAACPTGAITEVPDRVGVVETGAVAGLAGPGTLDIVTGTLDIGNVKAPSVIRAARKKAHKLDRDVTFLDAPPGVACAPVASIRDADALVLVTEPTPFGLHDLELAVELGRDFGIPIGAVINRDGAGGADVAAYCAGQGIPVLGRIPFDRQVAEIYADGGLVLDAHRQGRVWFEPIWEAVNALARGTLDVGPTAGAAPVPGITQEEPS